MGNAINEDARQIWMAIRANGGWWSVRSIYHYWSPTFAEWEIRDALKALLAGRYLVEREQGQGLMTVAFTSECDLLPGTEEASAS